MRIGVLSGYYPGQRFDSVVNHGVYAERHGYAYIEANGPGRHRRPHFRKLEIVERYLPLFDWIFWLDDDAYFTDFAKPLESFLSDAEGVHMIVCRSPTHRKVFTKFTSGSFFLRNSERSFDLLRAAYNVDLAAVRRDFWHEGLGHFTEGEQTALVYVTETDPRFGGDVIRLMPHDAFNSRFDEYRSRMEEHFLVHFFGDKHAEKRAFCRTVGANEYIVPSSLLAQYQIRTPPSGWRRAAGRLWRSISARS